MVARAIADIERDISELSAADRTRLLRGLIADLDAPADADVDEAWTREARQRLTEIHAGTAETVPGQQVLNEARSRLK